MRRREVLGLAAYTLVLLFVPPLSAWARFAEVPRAVDVATKLGAGVFWTMAAAILVGALIIVPGLPLGAFWAYRRGRGRPWARALPPSLVVHAGLAVLFAIDVAWFTPPFAASSINHVPSELQALLGFAPAAVLVPFAAAGGSAWAEGGASRPASARPLRWHGTVLLLLAYTFGSTFLGTSVVTLKVWGASVAADVAFVLGTCAVGVWTYRRSLKRGWARAALGGTVATALVYVLSSLLLLSPGTGGAGLPVLTSSGLVLVVLELGAIGIAFGGIAPALFARYRAGVTPKATVETVSIEVRPGPTPAPGR